MSFKVGDKVRCVSSSDKLVVGGEYYIDVIYTGGEYIKLELNSSKYSKGYFEPVEDIIRISSWEELDGKECKEYRLINCGDCFDLRKNGNYSSNINFKLESTDKVIEWLKLFGFLVELIPEHTLSDREWHCVMMYQTGWIARDGGFYWHDRKPDKDEWSYIPKGSYYEISPDLFPWIKFASGAVAIEELKKLKRAGVGK